MRIVVFIWYTYEHVKWQDKRYSLSLYRRHILRRFIDGFKMNAHIVHSYKSDCINAIWLLTQVHYGDRQNLIVIKNCTFSIHIYGWSWVWIHVWCNWDRFSASFFCFTFQFSPECDDRRQSEEKEWKWLFYPPNVYH